MIRVSGKERPGRVTCVDGRGSSPADATQQLLSVRTVELDGRDQQLQAELFSILQILRSVGDGFPIRQWLDAIQVYAMSANNDLTSEELKQTLASVFPTQFYPGSIADRLLEEGREEGLEKGKLTGKIQVLQELLGDPISTDAELISLGRDALDAKLQALQARVRNHDT